jgi:hypothetical protein
MTPEFQTAVPFRVLRVAAGLLPCLMRGRRLPIGWWRLSYPGFEVLDVFGPVQVWACPPIVMTVPGGSGTRTDQARQLARALEYQWNEDPGNDPFAIR